MRIGESILLIVGLFATVTAPNTIAHHAFSTEFEPHLEGEVKGCGYPCLVGESAYSL